MRMRRHLSLGVFSKMKRVLVMPMVLQLYRHRVESGGYTYSWSPSGGNAASATGLIRWKLCGYGYG
jgi:hypothetical protein